MSVPRAERVLHVLTAKVIFICKKRKKKQIACSKIKRVSRLWQSFNVFLCKVFVYQDLPVSRCIVMKLIPCIQVFGLAFL